MTSQTNTYANQLPAVITKVEQTARSFHDVHTEYKISTPHDSSAKFLTRPQLLPIAFQLQLFSQLHEGHESNP